MGNFQGFDYTYGVGMEFKASSAKQVKDQLKLNLETLAKMVKSYDKVLKIDPNADLSKLYDEVKKIQGLMNGINGSNNSFADFVDKGVLGRISALENGLKSISATSQELGSSFSGLKTLIESSLDPLMKAGQIKFPHIFEGLTDKSSEIQKTQDQIKQLETEADKVSNLAFKIEQALKGNGKKVSVDQNGIQDLVRQFNELEKVVNSGAGANQLVSTAEKYGDASSKLYTILRTMGDKEMTTNGLDGYRAKVSQTLQSLVNELDKHTGDLDNKVGTLEKSLEKLNSEQSKYTSSVKSKTPSMQSLGIAKNEDGSNLMLRAKVVPDTTASEWVTKINQTIKEVEPSLSPVRLTPTFSKGANVEKELSSSVAQINHAMRIDFKVDDNLNQFNERIKNIDMSIKNAKRQLEQNGNFKIRFEYEEGGKFRDQAYKIINQFKKIEATFHIQNGKKYLSDVSRLKERSKKELTNIPATLVVKNQDNILSSVGNLRSEIEKKISNIEINFVPKGISQNDLLKNSSVISSTDNAANASTGMAVLSEKGKEAQATIEKVRNTLQSLQTQGFKSPDFLKLGAFDKDLNPIKNSKKDLAILLKQYDNLYKKLNSGKKKTGTEEEMRQLQQMESFFNEVVKKQVEYSNKRLSSLEQVVAKEKEIAEIQNKNVNANKTGESSKKAISQSSMSVEDAQKQIQSLNDIVDRRNKVLDDLKSGGFYSKSFVQLGEWDKETNSFKKNSDEIQNLLNRYNELKKARLDAGTGARAAGEEAKIRGQLSAILRSQKSHISEIINKNKEEIASLKQVSSAYKDIDSNKSKVANTKSVVDVSASTKQIDDLTIKLNKAKEALSLLETNKLSSVGQTGLGDINKRLAGSGQSFEQLIQQYNTLIAKRAELEKRGLDVSHPEYVAYAKQYQSIEQQLGTIYQDQLKYTQSRVSQLDTEISKEREILQLKTQQTKEGIKQNSTVVNNQTGSGSIVTKLDDGALLNSIAKDSTLHSIDGKLANILGSLNNKAGVSGAVTGNIPLNSNNAQSGNINDQISSGANIAIETQQKLNSELEKTVQISKEAASSIQKVDVYGRTTGIVDTYKSKDKVVQKQEISKIVKSGKDDPGTLQHVSTVYKTNMEAFNNLYNSFVQSLAKQKEIEQRISSSSKPTNNLQEQLKAQQEITSTIENQLQQYGQLYTESMKQNAVLEANKRAQQEIAKISAAEKDKAINKQNQGVANIVNKAQDQLNVMQYAQSNSRVPMADAAIAKIKEYEGLLTNLKIKQQEILNNPNLLKDADYSTGFNSLLLKMKDVEKEFNSLTQSSNNFFKNINNANDIKQLGTTFDPKNLSQMHVAMQTFANEVSHGQAKLIEFNDAERRATFEINNGKGQVHQLAVAYDEATNSLGRYITKTTNSVSQTQKFFASVKQSFNSVARYLTTFGSVYRIIAMVRKGLTYVKEINTALTNLKKVTNETDATYEKFLQNMSKTASVVGSTVKDLTAMTAEWARLGYSMEESSKLAESTAMLLNVSGFTDTTQATEALISTLQAFGYAADESSRIVDILNEVGNEYAVSSDGLSTALQHSASALMAAGNDLEQSVALIAAANKVVQDPNSVGTALRTISLRLRGTTVKVLEEMGEETDGVIESTSKLQAKIKALSGVDILTDEGSYKDTYTILKEIGHVWQDMADIDRAALLELMAGKNRSNALSALLTNMEDLENAYESAANSEGSAQRGLDLYLDSIQGRISLFTNAVQTMWMNFISSDALKFIVDLGTALMKVVDTIGLIPSVVGLFTAIKAISVGISTDFEAIKNGTYGVVAAKKQEAIATMEAAAAKQVETTANEQNIVSEQLDGEASIVNAGNNEAEALSSYNVTTAKGEEAVALYSSADAEQIEGQMSLFAAGANNTEQVASAGVESQVAQETLVKQTNLKVTKALAVAKNLGKGLLIGAITMAATSLISKAIQSISEYSKRMEEATSNAITSAEQVDEARDGMEDYKKEIDSLRATLNSANVSEEDAYNARSRLIEIQNELIDKYGSEAESINLVNGALDEQIAKIDQLTQKKATAWFMESGTNGASNNEAYQKAVDAMYATHTSSGLTLYNKNEQGGYTSYTTQDMLNMSESQRDEYFKGVSKIIEKYGGRIDERSSTRTSDTGGDITTTTGYLVLEDKTVEELKQIYQELYDYTAIFGKDVSSGLNGILNGISKELAKYNTEEYIKQVELYDVGRQTEAYAKYAIEYGKILNSQEGIIGAASYADRAAAIDTYKDDVLAAFVAAGGELNENGIPLTIDYTNSQAHMQEFFLDMYNQYAQMELEINLKVNEDGLKTEIEDIVQKYNLSDLDNNQLADIGNRIEQEIIAENGNGNFIDSSGAYTSEQIDGYLMLQSVAEACSVSIEELISVMTTLGLIQGLPSEIVTQMEQSYKTYSEITSEIETYNDILSQTEEIIFDNIEVTQDYKDAIIELVGSSDEVNRYFDENNSLLVKNAKGLRDLVKSTKVDTAQNIRLAKSQAMLQYYELAKEIGQLIPTRGSLSEKTLAEVNALYQEMTALQKTISKYTILEQKLLGAANAYDELEKAQQADEETDYGTKAEEMVNVLANAFNTSELGTEAARVAIEGLIPDDVIDKSKTLDEQMQQIYKYFTGGEVSKLFHIEFDDDGGISSVEMTKENVEAYVKALLNKDYINEAGESLGSIFSGTWDEFDLNPAITSLEDFADACGITEEVAFAFLTELERYDIQNALGGDNINLLDQLMGDDPEYRIYKTTSEIAELQHQLSNGQISIKDYQNAMGGLTWQLDSGQISQDEYTEKVTELNDQLVKGTITAEEYERAVRGLSGVEEDNAKATVRFVTQWEEANEKVNTLTEEYEAAVDELEQLNKTDGVDASTYQDAVDKVNELSTELDEALQAKLALGEEPTVVELQYALDTLDTLIAEWEAQNPELYAKIKGKVEIDQETGEYTIDQEVYASLNPTSQALVDEHLNNLNNKAKIEVKLQEGQEDVESQIQEITTAAEAAKAAVEDIPDATVGTSQAVHNINTLTNAAKKALQSLNNLDGKTVTTYTKNSISTIKSSDLNGTAHKKGTAFKSGSWGAPRTETALVGEVGPELLVRGNQWTTIGENGAEFTKIKKGDVIFNHLQTRDLLSKGYITGRGKLKGGSAFASGTAYASINTWDDAHDRFSKDYNNTSLSKDLSSAASKISDAADEFEEVFDWIEVRLEEIEESLNLLSAQLENATNYSSKNSIVDKMIGVNETKMSNLKAGIEEYAAYASKLLAEVPEKYKQAAQDGAIAITEFASEADEKTVEAINNYREWAQKVANLTQQLEEVQTEIRDLARQKFDNVYDAGDVRATVEDSQTKKLQDAVDLDEEMGLITASAYYTAMMENSNKTIEYLTETRKEMQKVFDQAVQAGQIIRGSNEWYEMVDELYQVQSEIDEATKELEEFQNAINEIHWDNFEQLTTRLEYLKNETQSLIDLMDSDDMFTTPDDGRKYDGGTVEYWTEDDVKWTKEGLASMGLYAQQMEIAEYTARQYAEAIDELEVQFKAGLYSENEYQEKLEELTSAQYENIESYYEAQDAIKELNEERIDSIKEGIEKEIEAYEELIEKKKEELDAEKDLYDFQKSTMEQQKNIADIERKLAALANDNSLSAAAKRKQLEAELAEAQYELQDSYYNRSVEDKQNALDKELEDFQAEKDAEIAKWDEYLTNVELIITDSLNIIQSNAIGIYDTLNSKAEEYDLTLSDAVMAPWQDGALAVSDYQTSFDTAMSSTMDQLEALKAKWQEVIDTMAKVGEQKVDIINKENAAYAAATKKEPPKQTTTTATTTNKNQSSSQTKAVSVGSMINASGAKIYGKPGGSGSKQYFSSDPKYVVIGDSGDYWKVRWHKATSGVTGYFKKSDVKAYAKGAVSVDEDQWALINELGDELQIVPGANGNIEYIKKGTGIVPAALTERLMNLAMNPQDMIEQNRPAISPENIINTEIKLDCSVGTLVNIEHCDQNTLPDVEKLVNKAFDKHMQNLNNSIRKFAR